MAAGTAGSVLGQNYHRVGNWLGPVTKVVLAALVVAYVIRVIRLRCAKRTRRERGEAPAGGEPLPAPDHAEPVQNAPGA